MQVCPNKSLSFIPLVFPRRAMFFGAVCATSGTPLESTSSAWLLLTRVSSHCLTSDRKSHQPITCPCVPIYTTPTSSLLPSLRRWRHISAGADAWDSCYQKLCPWQVDPRLPVSRWVAVFRPLSNQTDQCLLRAS